MANHKSAIKRIRQSEKRAARNKAALSRMRTFNKAVVKAVESGNLEKAQSALRQAVSVTAVTVRKGVIHKNQGARRVRRMNAKVKALAFANAAG